MRCEGDLNSAAVPATVSDEPNARKPLKSRRTGALGRRREAVKREPGDLPSKVFSGCPAGVPGMEREH